MTPDSALLFNKKAAQCKEQARKGEGGREGKGREKGSKVTGHPLAFHFDCCTLPYPCISEMLIKGRCPEELNARLGPAPFSQIKLVNLQRGHRFSPGGCSVFELESSLQVFAHLFSQKANAV